MSIIHKAWFLVGAGFLVGSAGLKLLSSSPARKVYVQGVAAGMRAKNYYEEIVEEAKANVDDIVAEANYINEVKDDGMAAEGCSVETETAATQAPAKKASKDAGSSKENKNA